MPIGLHLRITDTKANTRTVRAFAPFPVRIGRNPLNDLHIVEAFVSQFHAVVEIHGDVLMLRDLGSRNGTKLSNGTRAPAHEPVDLASSKNEFSIGPLSFQALVANVDAPVRGDTRPTGTTGNLAETRVVLDRLPAAAKTLAFDNAAFAEARAKLVGGAAGNLAGTLALDPPAFVPGVPKPPPASPAMREKALEAIALQGIRELAQLYLPKHAQIETPEDLAKFLAKVRDTLDVFLRCFIPLRDGYRQFATEMDIRKTNRMRPVEAATNEHDLAQHLLDWTNEDGTGHRAVEGTFADLMIHQLALLNAIMRGVKSLLNELSPASIDRTLEDLAKTGKTGFTWGPWRFKELWRVYGGKYGDVDDGDKRTFTALFGREFAEAYNQYRGVTDDVPQGE